MANDTALRLDLAHPDWTDDLKKVEAAILADITRPVIVDASAATEVGALAAQLLIAARRAASTEGRSFAVEAPSDAVRDSLDRMGLSAAVLGAPETEVAG
ncbi:STAS domain-containing protein [Wenxinia marina]|uniref:Anti-anti-sigma regulatory factor (Antagonist of anti-sigma factor) n=1 Tax=Wenxinia marina DSM 24838 TaxID=1123501 RepID=A0A0D0Q8F3_9RHOB|nr:STAS domain-containing protein [Wenxinia marina]KIQ67408.1 Anti-anti-sigma regulatory factor (antagonist of anti-sigma factor) [Wenxinia marina DSM 24838]GGL69725.1 hypothetical protein GCM10011392_25280 [Wenxinia marina]